MIAAQTTLASVQLQWPESNSDINIYISAARLAKF